jgi:hypothetical protein
VAAIQAAREPELAPVDLTVPDEVAIERHIARCNALLSMLQGSGEIGLGGHHRDFVEPAEHKAEGCAP